MPVVVMAHGFSATITMVTDRYAEVFREAGLAGAVDDRAAAVVAQIPAIGAEISPSDPDGSLFAAMADTLRDGDVAGGPSDTTGPRPVVSADQLDTPSALKPIQAYRWFIDHGGRFGTAWENRVIRVVPPTPCPFHAGIAAPHLHPPLFMMIAPDDEMVGANPEVSRATFATAPDPKTLVEIDGGHFGLLHHPSPLFEEASTAQADFLRRTLC